MKRKPSPILTALVASAALAGTAAKAQTPYPGQIWSPDEAHYTATATEEVTITLSDGTELVGVVARPTDRATGQPAEGTFPVIVEFSPYLRLAEAVGPNPYLTEHGYIYALVRPRGTGGSGGEMQQFTSQDGRDGAEVVDWAAGLDGSDGRVGLLGCSYPGATGLATAAEVGPESPLKAVVAACIGLDMQHRQVWTTNGLPNAALNSYGPRATMLMGDQPSVRNYFSGFVSGVMAGGPEAYDGYWQDRLPLSRAEAIVENGIPTLLWIGWSDINEIGGIHAYLAMQNAAAGRPVFAPMDTDRTDPRWQIIVGDWGHAKGLDAGLYLQWFETWLKGVDTGIGATATPMHVFEKGTDRWINLAGYPVAPDTAEWHFGPDGALTEAPPAGQGAARLDWGSPEAENGRLAYTTPPFADGVTIAGPISATIFASSSNANLELIASLYDVAADGTAKRISMGAVLGSQSRLADGKSWFDGDGTMTWPWPELLRDEALTPGQPTRFDLFLAVRQWGVAPGHSLRLELTTQSGADVCPAEGVLPMVSEPCRLTAPPAATLPGGT
ncbi:CocE/NonD family hydrolase, partial [Tropicimonas sp.]|uniref:CocE/NonD family hydrolase n=1 Tax=Tropicimonas sp. TaxID=2067044 RepID=UPI003A85017E